MKILVDGFPTIQDYVIIEDLPCGLFERDSYC